MAKTKKSILKKKQSSIYFFILILNTFLQLLHKNDSFLLLNAIQNWEKDEEEVDLGWTEMHWKVKDVFCIFYWEEKKESVS